LLIVVAAPGFDLFLSILQAQKPVFIQALLPETAVDDSMKALSVGFPGREKSRTTPWGLGPQVYFLGDELRAPDPGSLQEALDHF
jgi:hypothetical protein